MLRGRAGPAGRRGAGTRVRVRVGGAGVMIDELKPILTQGQGVRLPHDHELIVFLFANII